MSTEAERQRLLAPVIRAARDELADKDLDDTPHALRPVAQSTARKLPPPLAKVLLDAVGSDADLRSRVVDRLDDTPLSPAAAAFLTDPAGSVDLIELELRADVANRLERDLVAASSTIEKLTAREQEGRARLKAAEAEHERKLVEADAAYRRATEGVQKRLAQAETRYAELVEERDALESQIGEHHESIAYMRLRLAKRQERAQRRASSEPNPRPSRAIDIPVEPVALAAFLDRQVGAMKYYREHSPVERIDANRQPSHELRLPPGIAPDTAAGVDAALASDPDRVLIDGYNVAGSVDERSVGTRTGRAIAIGYAERLKARIPKSDVVVVFDAGGAGGRGHYRTEVGVEVVFEGDSIADDRIADDALGRDDRCVVVTSDRELQDRCHRDGCVAVFSEAFVTFIEG